MVESKTVYGVMRRDVRGVWFYLSLDENRERYGEWHGPYRDETDAENGAEDLCKIMKKELVW